MFYYLATAPLSRQFTDLFIREGGIKFNLSGVEIIYPIILKSHASLVTSLRSQWLFAVPYPPY